MKQARNSKCFHRLYVGTLVVELIALSIGSTQSQWWIRMLQTWFITIVKTPSHFLTDNADQKVRDFANHKSNRQKGQCIAIVLGKAYQIDFRFRLLQQIPGCQGGHDYKGNWNDSTISFSANRYLTSFFKTTHCWSSKCYIEVDNCIWRC